jgi:hypothetical protein
MCPDAQALCSAARPDWKPLVDLSTSIAAHRERFALGVVER